MLNRLAKIANKLDNLGLTKEADVLDKYIQKVAQQVATTGVAGAAYGTSPTEIGRQVTPGKPGGVAVKFYKAKPKTIGEFNSYLAALINDIGRDRLQRVFSKATVASSGQLSTQTNWSELTASAFKEYASAVGSPEAGMDWQKWAKGHNYEPTMGGIYAFWADTISKAMDLGNVYVQSLTDIGEKEEGKIPAYEEAQATKGPSSPDRDGRLKPDLSAGPKADMDEMEKYIKQKEEEAARQKKQPRQPIDRSTLEGRLRWHFTGGSGVEFWWDKSGKFNTTTNTKRALELINSVKTPEAKAWFSQSPKIVLPDEFTKYSDIYDIKSWAVKQSDGKVPNFNQEVESIYMQLADLFKAGQDASREHKRQESLRTRGYY